MNIKNLIKDYKKACIDNYNHLKIRLVATACTITTLGLLGFTALETGCLYNNFDLKKYKDSLERIINESQKKGLIIRDDNFMNKNIKKVQAQASLNYSKTNFKTNNFYKDSDKVLLARLIFGEARFCSNKEKIAVAYTVLNRLKLNEKCFGKNKIHNVILKPRQYSCFNKDDLGFRKVKNPMKYHPKTFKICLKIAEEVLNRKHRDITRGATHYFNPKFMKPKWSYPKWAKKAKKIGRIKVNRKRYTAHIFYK